MMYGEMKEDQFYFHETAWAELRESWTLWQSGRKAKAQEKLFSAMYYANKVPAEYTEPELKQNLEKFSTIILRGY